MSSKLLQGFLLGPWKVEPLRGVISGPNDETNHLEPKVMDVFVCLAERTNELVTRNQLLDVAWSGNTAFDEQLTRAIGVLRRALHDDPGDPKYIETVPKRGYRLVGNVRLPDGTKLEKDLPRIESIAPRSQYKMAFVIVIVLALALVYFAYDEFVVERVREETPASTSTQVEDLNETDRWEMSVAVLPFVNMSDDPGNEYFSDGLSEEILTLLAKIPGLKVIGRTSSFAFKGKNEDLRVIGQTLDVMTVLEGSVRKSGDRVRITAQLVDVSDGAHIWSENYDRTMTDIFKIQEEIASAIGAALQVELGLKVAQSLDRRRTNNTEAYQWYLRGQQLIQKFNSTNVRLAAEAFQKAIELDPNYVPPYVGYAVTQTGLTLWGLGSVTELLQEAEQALDVVARLDPEYSRRFVALGLLNARRNDWAAAESAYKRAFKLSPKDLFVQAAWANYLGLRAGRPEEAIELYQQYLQREPLDLGMAVDLAQVLLHAGRIVEAEAEVRRVIEIDPGYSRGYRILSNLYQYVMNRIAESLPLRRKSFDLDSDAVSTPNSIARAFLELGDDAVAERWIQEAERISDRSYFTTIARYFLSRYRDDEPLAELLSRQLADMVQVNRPGWSYIADFAWLRALQVYDPVLALRVYETLSPDVVADEPTVGPWSHATAISLAGLYLQTGNEALANDLLDQSLAVIESTTHRYYHPAKTAIYAMKGDTPKALKELRISIDADWRWEWWMLEKDPIYEPLWDEPEFKVMMDEIRADMAAQLEQVREMRRNGELRAIPEAVLAE
jgi:TolB-like protein/DNA-binding winged helix-turn-helix (wHTH) protein